MQCPQDRIAAVFLLREVTGNRCDPSLNRSVPLFGELGGRKASQGTPLLAVDNQEGMKRKGRGRKRSGCAIDVAGMNHCPGELAKQEAGDGEVDTLTYCGFANTLKDRPECGDFADEDDGLVVTKLLDVGQPLMNPFNSSVILLHPRVQGCSAQQAAKA